MTDIRTITLNDLYDPEPDTGKAVLLFRQERHTVYWIGIMEETAFRCNTYLVTDGEEGLLIDPGGRQSFEEIRARVESVLPANRLLGLVMSHQDPDVAASMYDWLKLRPELEIFATPRTHILLSYYCQKKYLSRDIEKNRYVTFKNGNQLHFIPAPFLHFPGAVTTFDPVSGYLFSGDVWAALEVEQEFIVSDFKYHAAKMDLFHKDYMACNKAAKGFTTCLMQRDIKAILPQHGSLIPEHLVQDAITYLRNLQCGLDLIYPADDLDSYRCEKTEADAKDDASYNFPLESHAKPDDDRSDENKPDTRLKEALLQTERLARINSNALKQLKIAELALKKNSERLIEAQSIASLGYWEWDIRSNKVRWSDETFKIFGLDQHDFQATYDAFLQLVHDDDKKDVEKAVREAIEKDHPYDIIHRILRPDGETRTVHERAKVQRDNNGEALSMLGTVQDITELHNIEKNLASKNRLINAIQRMQANFINNSNILALNSTLLDDLLELTESEHGFTCSVLKDPEGKSYLAIHAITDMSWNDESRKLYQQVQRKGLEFHNLDNLIGAAIIEGRAIISDNPQNDPRGKGFPEGHPEIKNFLGIPVRFKNKIVGEIGLANRRKGYNKEILEYIEPLVTAFGQVLIAKRDQEARRAAEKVLSQQARLDGLLGIPNRRYFDEHIKEQLRNARRNQSPLSIIMIDVDFFKLFNDCYGHQKGDKCLIEVAETIRNSLRRPMDFLARYGGEEICCILPDTDLDGALKVAANIENGLKQKAIPHAESPASDMVTVSMGIATWVPGTEITEEELVRQADMNLYIAKRNGRNRTVYTSVEN
jgi:diguanylate cyclase (GGDEF)-like protein/PAS domain S-box-containing protein